MAGLYIHVPFCKQKCGYCDFYSCTNLSLLDNVHAATAREMQEQRDFLGREPLRTIYFGGGTPTVYAPEKLQELIDRARTLWDCSGVIEITAEANPDDLTPQYLERLALTDIDRLSIGIQSFIDRDLRFMNRRHNARAAEQAVRDARNAGFGNITMDLIYGIPGMSAAEWRYNIEKALSLGVEHISAYHLTIENGTAFGRDAAAGKLGPVADEQSEEQYLMLHRMLTEAGYEHYEISNFALPGFRARHNSSYWSGQTYLGVGPAAHSYDGVVRRGFPADTALYLTDRANNYLTETLAPDDLYNEFVMTSLRTAEGVDIGRMTGQFGQDKTQAFIAAAQRYVASGLLMREGDRIFVPAEKFLVSDAVISALFV